MLSNNHKFYFLTGFAEGAVIFTNLAQVDQGLRIIASVIGIVLGTMGIIKAVLDFRKTKTPSK